MVAIGIIVLLAILSVTGYTSFRKSSLLNLSVDSFILRLDELKSSASGDCAGINFGDEVYTYKQNFSDKKVWKDEIIEFGYVGCDGEIYDKKTLEVDNSVKFNSITLFDEAGESLVLKSYGMRFVPPKGTLEISLNDGPFLPPYYKSVSFVISSGEKNIRSLKYDFNSLNFVRVDE